MLFKVISMAKAFVLLPAQFRQHLECLCCEFVTKDYEFMNGKIFLEWLVTHKFVLFFTFSCYKKKFALNT
jgi:hypothetical protein